MENQERDAADRRSAPAEAAVSVQVGGSEAGLDAPPAGGDNRRRLDMALAVARGDAGPEPMARKRRGLPGLRKELFPAASWRHELESLHLRDRDRAERLRVEEDARVALSLAGIRAEEILRRARTQARRLVNTASAVARARQEQAERAAKAKETQAEADASTTLAEAARRAEAMVADSGLDMNALYSRLLQMQTALRDAETRLAAFAEATRADLAAAGEVVDLDSLSEEPAAPQGAGWAPPPGESADGDRYTVPAPRRRPKSRFEVPGLTAERIKALRDEFSP